MDFFDIEEVKNFYFVIRYGKTVKKIWPNWTIFEYADLVNCKKKTYLHYMTIFQSLRI